MFGSAEGKSGVMAGSYGSAVAAICNYLSSTSPAAAATALSPETRLLGSDLLDSLGIVQLTTYLADDLGVMVEDEDFTPENFETIGSLARFVELKTRAAA